MAMGNWINTPTPPDDDDAPPPRGNAGEATFRFDGDTFDYLVHLAKMDTGGRLVVEGEPLNAVPRFRLLASLDRHDLSQARNLVLELSCEEKGSYLVGNSEKRVPFTAGTLGIESVTGQGPWEIDALVEGQTDQGPVKGHLQARISRE